MNDTDLQPNQLDRVRFLDWVMLIGGAIALVTTGILGLGMKAYNNALDPKRAEAVAKSIIDYRIPAGSQGKFGIKVAGIKLAIVHSKTSPPDVEIFVMQTPLNRDTRQQEELERLRTPIEPTPTQFEVYSTTQQNLQFCNKPLNVTIYEGSYTVENQSSTLPAVQFSASTIINNERLIVEVQALGKNAKQKALAVFKSIKCK
ncbi:hypothetical protein NIES2119_11245 [[Phormidium ambiguum] IAM M-71]|uniref:Uncharacterized protein n=1 Tax=[Phormidium ambiguum] IAM M-71 TaxID=454136 RepID=A0A1U7ILI0_9CYAN|nr:hypothetical protein [Phormidium ambiguum]OKH38124.1 hypothetical protein NIES2119_11245 [Phormidium ambiguum IAM M-71]